jgi:hypothetical protein
VPEDAGEAERRWGMNSYICTRNRILRPKVNAKLDDVSIGTRVKVHEIASQSSSKRLQVNPKTIANMLKERPDYRPLGKGVWERIPV